MALQKVGEQALTAFEEQNNEKIVPIKPKKIVVDEEKYTEDLEKIIVRDFYPDIPKLQAQSDYLDAVATNDIAKLREIHIKYGPKRGSAETPSIYSTPATFETPTPHPKDQQTPTPQHGQDSQSRIQGDLGSTHNPEPQEEKKQSYSDLSLDKYLSKTTSEDNASFIEIMKKNEEQHRHKHAWLYDKEKEQKHKEEEILALPSIEKQAIECGSKVEGWKYTAKNSVMYVPDGFEKNAKELVENKKKPKEIHHDNTRFLENPHNLAKCKETIVQAASAKAAMLCGRIGPDGKEVLPEQSPRVNGYGFVATPSPAPGVEDSPLMTWGEIEGSPFRLDATPGPRTPGPTFKIPDVPRREQLAYNLVDEASKKNRAKKEQALKRVSASFGTPSPKFGSASKTDRLHSLSPAAQKLANSKLRIRTNSDKALKASYTPSPTHTLPGDKTPIMKTPTGKTPTRTPTGTPSQSPKISTPSKRTDSDISSLTDNLLNLPKRQRAQDFF